MAETSKGTGASERTLATEAADLETQLKALRADMAELAATVGRIARAQADTIGSHARESLRSAHEAGQERLSAASEFAGRKYAETEDYIRANPAVAIGVAAGVGFLIGLVSARR